MSFLHWPRYRDLRQNKSFPRGKKVKSSSKTVLQKWFVKTDQEIEILILTFQRPKKLSGSKDGKIQITKKLFLQFISTKVSKVWISRIFWPFCRKKLKELIFKLNFKWADVWDKILYTDFLSCTEFHYISGLFKFQSFPHFNTFQL